MTSVYGGTWRTRSTTPALNDFAQARAQQLRCCEFLFNLNLLILTFRESAIMQWILALSTSIGTLLCSAFLSAAAQTCDCDKITDPVLKIKCKIDCPPPKTPTPPGNPGTLVPPSEPVIPTIRIDPAGRLLIDPIR